MLHYTQELAEHPYFKLTTRCLEVSALNMAEAFLGVHFIEAH